MNESAAAADIFIVPPELEPKDREDGSKRLYYFASIAMIMCRDALYSFVGKCMRGEAGPELQKATANPFDAESRHTAIKELTCISIYLTMSDQGPDAPDWLSSFLATSVKSLDRMINGGNVKDIMVMHEYDPPEDLPVETAVNACRALGLRHIKRDDVAPLSQFFEASRASRSRVLQFALSAPYDVLEAKIQQLMTD